MKHHDPPRPLTEQRQALSLPSLAATDAHRPGTAADVAEPRPSASLNIDAFDPLRFADRRCLRSSAYPQLLAALARIGISLRRGDDIEATVLCRDGERHEVLSAGRVDRALRQPPPAPTNHRAVAIEAVITAYALAIDAPRWATCARAFHPSSNYSEWRDAITAGCSYYTLHDARRLIEYFDADWPTIVAAVDLDLAAALAMPALTAVPAGATMTPEARHADAKRGLCERRAPRARPLWDRLP